MFVLPLKPQWHCSSHSNVGSMHKLRKIFWKRKLEVVEANTNMCKFFHVGTKMKNSVKRKPNLQLYLLLFFF